MRVDNCDLFGAHNFLVIEESEESEHSTTTDLSKQAYEPYAEVPWCIDSTQSTDDKKGQHVVINAVLLCFVLLCLCYGDLLLRDE